MVLKAETKLDSRVAAAQDTLKVDPERGRGQLRSIIAEEGTDSEELKVKEQAIGCLTSALADAGDADSLKQLLDDLKPMHSRMPKARTAKIVRTVIDALERIPNTNELQVWHLYDFTGEEHAVYFLYHAAFVCSKSWQAVMDVMQMT
jgi:26S proteasome regulatory subunit N6